MGTAERFWLTRATYPTFGPLERRRLDLAWLLPRITGPRVVDVGSGDGWLVETLLRVSDFDLVAVDLNEGFLGELDPRISTCSAADPLPASDTTLMLGLIQYLSDVAAVELLAQAGPNLLVRTPCAPTTLTVDGWSDALGAFYRSTYRSLPETVALLAGCGFGLVEALLAYPKALDSRYGTRTYYLQAEAQ